LKHFGLSTFFFLVQFSEFCFPWFSPKAEAELKIPGFVSFEIEASFVREKQVIESIGYG